jgi:hypothetical protein
MAKPKLTMKQAKFVKAKTEGKSGTQAYMEAYETNNAKVASVEASRLLAKPSIQEIVQESMERQGVTVDLVVKPIVDGLNANKIHITDSGIEHSPDHSVRLKASGMALDLMGAKSRGEAGNTTIIFNKGDVVKDKYVKD